MKKLRQNNKINKTKNQGKKPTTSSTQKNKKKQKSDDESISDSGSETGWNSEDDVYLRTEENDQGVDEEDDDDYEEEGGILLSDLLELNLKKQAKKDNKIVQPPKSKLSKKEEDLTFLEEDDDEDDYDDEDDEDDEEDDYDVDEENEEDDYDDEEGDDEDLEDMEVEEFVGDENDISHEEESVDVQNEVESDDEDNESNEDSEEEVDHEANRNLLVAIEKFAKVGNHDKSKVNSLIPEKTSMSGTQGLTMSALLGELGENTGFSAIKSKLSELEKKSSAPVYVEKVVSERMERQETYSANKQDMNKWHETIVENRNVATLDLAQDKRRLPKYRSLVSSFVPQTSFEKEINMVLVQSGATEDSLEQREINNLQSRNMSLDDIKEKQKELSKVNALMFYEQMKRHRINKIKSKAFRAIQRKKRSKLEDQLMENLDNMDEEDAQELIEKNALKRVKERMDLKHKNTSKWAKMALEHGHTDKSLRDAYHESVRLGHELTQKINEDIRSKDQNDNNESEEDNDNDGNITENVKKQLKKVINDDDDSVLKVSGKYQKLFEMDFMKKASEQQKLKAKEEALQILREIQELDNENDIPSDFSDADDRKKNESILQKEEREKAKQKAKEEIKKQFQNNSFQLSMKPSTSFISSTVTEPQGSLVQEPNAKSLKNTEKPKEKKKVKIEEETIESNPWLQSTSVSNRKVSKNNNTQDIDLAISLSSSKTAISSTNTNKDDQKSKMNNKKRKQDEIKDQVISNSEATEITEKKIKVEENEKKEAPKALTNRTQDDLVRLAFNGPDFEADFLAHKRKEIDNELGLDEKKLKVLKDVKAGWGDWAGPGEGGMMISDKTLQKRDKLILKIQQENEVKRLDRKDAKIMNVMISERRNKNISKYKVGELPYPFTSKEDYERSLQIPLGEEWNTAHMVTKMTQPAVKTRAGRIIDPIKLNKKPVPIKKQQ